MSSHLSDPISDNAASVWPKRARDKIRCDGARPCGGCAKKGYAAEECTDGCEACRRARVRCEGGKPCRRCLEMKFECNDTTSISGQRPLTPPLSNRASRGGDRAKLACSSCRRDNKKCDDQRPCSRCVVRGEECIHVGRGPKLVKLRCEGCRDTKKRCEDTRPCRYCIESFKQCVIVPRKGRGHGTRVKAVISHILTRLSGVYELQVIAFIESKPSKAYLITDETKSDVTAIDRVRPVSRRVANVSSVHVRHAPEKVEVLKSAFPPETNEYKSEASFHIIQPPTVQVSNPRDRNQWPSFSTGLQSQHMHPMYPNVVPQPQYYFPPQYSNQPMQTMFSPTHRPYPGNDTQPSQQYYYSSNSGNYVQAMPSSSRTLPYNN
ncbi:hypothetical protein CVT25_010318 [Psilocybe cyanescens]|uniref:Zn(2)-C6 fungal-type domain-containing protein n=1 Tax=Psilocybe cyanescens TaxID=93625 RepID=A0A409VNS8_PSICY|nr:hypothetical protein CVT25_010318 [Psilocybe cyanescens]